MEPTSTNHSSLIPRGGKNRMWGISDPESRFSALEKIGCMKPEICHGSRSLADPSRCCSSCQRIAHCPPTFLHLPDQSIRLLPLQSNHALNQITCRKEEARTEAEIAIRLSKLQTEEIEGKFILFSTSSGIVSLDFMKNNLCFHSVTRRGHIV